jgi:glycosyltransferase involved in cell wall biosynthesis
VVHAQGEEAALLARRPRAFGLVVTPRYPSLPSALLRPGGPGVLGWLHLALREAKFLALGMAVRGADLVSPPSIWAGALLRRAYRLEPDRVRPVHNGVPAEFLDYRWQPADPHPPALFFGRFSPSKGVDTILEAAAQLREEGPPFLLVGSGPEEGRLRSEIERRSLGATVSMRGWADHRELGSLLSQASMALIPSREENFSLAVLSCMAVGAPLVTTPVGGTPEVVEDGRHGLLVPPGDSATLTAAIRRLRDDPAGAARMGAAAAARVRAEFTWAAAAAHFEKLYASLAS